MPPPRRRFLQRSLAALATAALPAGAAVAQTPPEEAEVLLKLQLCRSIDNRVFRLHCFDGLAREMAAQPTGRGAEAPPAMVEAKPQDGPGLAEPPPPPLEARPSGESPAEIATVQAPDEEPNAAIPPPLPRASLIATSPSPVEPVSPPAVTGSVPLPPDRGEAFADLSAAAAPVDELLRDPPAPRELPWESELAALPPDDEPPEGPVPGNWSVSDWTSPISGVRDISLTRASEAAVGTPVALLSFSCSGGGGALRVMWPSGMDAREVEAEMTLDAQAPETGTWRVSPDGRVMSRVESQDMLEIAGRAAAAETVTIRVAAGGGVREARFVTEGLQHHLKALQSACRG